MPGPTNTQFALGVHLLTLIGGHPDAPISSEAMSESTGASPVHSRRVLGELRRAGLVESRPGPRGGWQLTREPEAISLADVWDAVHGEEPVLGLHSVDPDCPVGHEIQGALTVLDREVVAAVRAQLAARTIAQLLDEVARSALAGAVAAA
jgi:Rrf2 family protein